MASGLTIVTRLGDSRDDGSRLSLRQRLDLGDEHIRTGGRLAGSGPVGR